MSQDFENSIRMSTLSTTWWYAIPMANPKSSPSPKEGTILRIGRELDNEIILVDPRASDTMPRCAARLPAWKLRI
jgi:hypothetical protein